jgi:hypothetical protein
MYVDIERAADWLMSSGGDPPLLIDTSPVSTSNTTPHVGITGTAATNFNEID